MYADDGEAKKYIKYIIRIHEIVQRHINYNFNVYCVYEDLPQSIHKNSTLDGADVVVRSESQGMKFQLILIAEILSTFSGGIVLLLEGCRATHNKQNLPLIKTFQKRYVSHRKFF